MAELRKAFSICDLDGSGTIVASELRVGAPRSFPLFTLVQHARLFFPVCSANLLLIIQHFPGRFLPADASDSRDHQRGSQR